MESVTNNKDILITAIGYNSPSGTGLESFIKQINSQHTETGKEIEVVDPQLYLGTKGIKFLNKATKMYCNVAFQCIEEQQLKQHIEASADKIGLYDCSDLSNIQDGFLFDLTAKVEGPDSVSPMSAPNTIANASSSQMAIKSNIKGPNFTVCSGACSSLQALDIANLHLKQGIINHAIVGSTEVVAKYQEAVRRGEKRGTDKNSNEVAVAMLLQRRDELTGEKQYARVLGFQSGTQLLEENPEELLQRLINQSIKQHPEFPVDLIVVGGGYHNLNLQSFESKLAAKVPVAYPESLLGSGDNAGGMLGVLYAIGIFRNEIKEVVQLNGQDDFVKKEIDTRPIGNVLVCTIDKTGYALVTLITK